MYVHTASIYIYTHIQIYIHVYTDIRIHTYTYAHIYTYRHIRFTLILTSEIKFYSKVTAGVHRIYGNL